MSWVRRKQVTLAKLYEILTKMESEPLHDNSMWIQNMYAHGAIKKNFTWQNVTTLIDSNTEIEEGTFCRDFSVDFVGLDCVFQQI
jgi:hypothetical protein